MNKPRKQGDIAEDMRYGYIRSTHDKDNHYKFYDVDEKLRLCDWPAGAFPPFDFVPGIVHMLDDKPVSLNGLVKRVQEYNNQWHRGVREYNNQWVSKGGFDVLDIPRLLLAGIEIGAISVVRIEGEAPDEANDEE